MPIPLNSAPSGLFDLGKKAENQKENLGENLDPGFYPGPGLWRLGLLGEYPGTPPASFTPSPAAGSCPGWRCTNRDDTGRGKIFPAGGKPAPAYGGKNKSRR